MANPEDTADPAHPGALPCSPADLLAVLGREAVARAVEEHAEVRECRSVGHNIALEQARLCMVLGFGC